MSEHVISADARCTECGRVYHLGSSGGAHICDDCSTPRIAASASRRHLREAITCPRCHVICPHGGTDCPECGASLGETATEGELEDASLARHQVAHSLRRGYRRMTVVTWLYRAGALVYAGVTVVAIMALTSVEVPKVGGILIVALTTLLTMLMLMGAMQVAFRPFLWTVLLASLATVVAVVHLFGPNPFGLMFFGTAAWAILFWAMLPSALELRKLIAQYTDEYVLHHASLPTRRNIKQHAVEERHERLLDVMRKAGVRAWKISGTAAAIVALASFLGVSQVLSNLRSQEFYEGRETFEAAWNGGNLAAVGELFAPQIQARKAARLAAVTDGHGWGGTLPPLEGGEARHTEDQAWVQYTAGGLTLSTQWSLMDREWRLLRVELPKPPFEPVLDRFRATWRHSDMDAIAAFFPEGYTQKMRASMTRSARLRDWKVLPEILSTEISGDPDGEMTVTFQLEKGVVSTKWLFRNEGNWNLQAFVFPKR